VRPAGLDDRPELLALGAKRLAQPVQGRHQLSLDCHGDRKLDRGRDDVVRGLAEVDVVVGVDAALAAAAAAQDLVRPSGDHLVGVGVGRGSGAGLVDVDRELVVELAVDDLLRRLEDRGYQFGVEEAELQVDLGGRPLDQAEGGNELAGKGLAGDGEVLNRALSRGAVVGVCRNLHLAHRVAFDPGFRHTSNSARGLRCQVCDGWRP
jgi:hypothetical protein